MTTSGNSNFSINRDQLIAGALRLCGVLAQGEVPTATQIAEASETLNMMVKAWQADGMPLWAIKQVNLSLVAGNNSYTLTDSRPLKVFQAFLHNTSSNLDIPMRILTRQEYNMLGNKTTTGQPIQLFYEPLRDTGVIHCFPTPDSSSASSNVITYVYQAPFEDFDSSTDSPDFPQEWYEAVKYGLALRLAGEYTIDAETRNLLTREAMAIKQEAMNFGLEEGSLFFQLDRRGW